MRLHCPRLDGVLAVLAELAALAQWDFEPSDTPLLSRPVTGSLVMQTSAHKCIQRIAVWHGLCDLHVAHLHVLTLTMSACALAF